MTPGAEDAGTPSSDTGDTSHTGDSDVEAPFAGPGTQTQSWAPYLEKSTRKLHCYYIYQVLGTPIY